ncbi:uncharacterized protein A4U43_C06F12640 [Asparagus officinalis]|uniref:Uncharacterized protein n=1 Tax=Asparagus officinalis TaxID=4686 RepID=A0A5P1ELQ2_ASPOF|nr:uncharacterized protein A4U43_C06F12640 [Asparagus officinalis]
MDNPVHNASSSSSPNPRALGTPKTPKDDDEEDEEEEGEEVCRREQSSNDKVGDSGNVRSRTWNLELWGWRFGGGA